MTTKESKLTPKYQAQNFGRSTAPFAVSGYHYALELQQNAIEPWTVYSVISNPSDDMNSLEDLADCKFTNQITGHSCSKILDKKPSTDIFGV